MLTDASQTPPPEHILITASFGRILSKGHLERFAKDRRLNVHPSLLPDYRGPAPLQRALLDGRHKTGVCIIEMLKKSEGIDAGRIWEREEAVRVFRRVLVEIVADRLIFLLYRLSMQMIPSLHCEIDWLCRVETYLQSHCAI